MASNKEYRHAAPVANDPSGRKILTLAGLKDRRDHTNRLFASEACKESPVKKEAR